MLRNSEPGAGSSHCVAACLCLSGRNKEESTRFTATKRGFCCARCRVLFPASPPRLLGAHFINFFSGPHLCPAECWSQPSRQQTRKSALLPACLAASSPPLRPADCGGTGQPLQANSLCPPPRAENELECCLPQTHRAAARKKDHTTRRLQPETVRNFLS